MTPAVQKKDFPLRIPACAWGQRKWGKSSATWAIGLWMLSFVDVVFGFWFLGLVFGFVVLVLVLVFGFWSVVLVLVLFLQGYQATLKSIAMMFFFHQNKENCGKIGV